LNLRVPHRQWVGCRGLPRICWVVVTWFAHYVEMIHSSNNWCPLQLRWWSHHCHRDHPVESRMLRTRKVTLLPLNNSEVLTNISRHCAWKNEWTSTSQSGAEIRKSEHTWQEWAWPHNCDYTILFNAHYMCNDHTSRGLDSTAECWTVWTGQRKVSGGHSVHSGGRARPLPTSEGRTLVGWYVVLCVFPTQLMSVEARHLRAQEVLLRMLHISSTEASWIIGNLVIKYPRRL